MPATMVQVALQGASLLPRDKFVNTFHFESAVQPDAATLVEIFADIEGFYDLGNPGPGTAVSSWIGPSVSRTVNVHQMKAYWLPDPQPRIPIGTTVFTLEPPGNTLQDLPSEVAVCLSYYAGSNVRRRRGRIYIGPLIDDAMTGGASPRVSSSLRGHLASAASRLVSESALNGTPWCVHSGAANQDFVITDGWIDNEFDTVRRRGLRSDARTTWT